LADAAQSIIPAISQHCPAALQQTAATTRGWKVREEIGRFAPMFPHGLRREVILLLCLKAAALTLLYFLFFSHKPAVTPAAVQQQLTRPL
jgi:hypothetical protein